MPFNPRPMPVVKLEENGFFQLAQQIITSVKFKRDYVAASAVVLFFLIVVSEITLAIAIPVVLGRASLYAEQEARQRMLDSFDAARFSSYGEVTGNPVASGEIALVNWHLNYLALYLRRYASGMSMAEISDMSNDVAEFSRVLQRVRQSQFCTLQVLNPRAYFRIAADASSGKIKK